MAETPGYGGPERTTLDGRQGTSDGPEPTFEPGNYTDSLFGVAIPQGTGAPGSQGAGGASDPTVMPGALDEGLSGLGPADTANTGSPGSAPIGDRTGGTQVSYTNPGSYLGGTYVTETVSGSVTGPDDWSQVSPGLYDGASKNLPGIPQAGAALADTGAGQGRVMRGGRSEG